MPFPLKFLQLGYSPRACAPIRNGVAREPPNYTSPSSGVRQTDCILFSFARARVTFAKMSEALAVQMNGFGSRLCLSMYCSMVLTNSGTE